VFERERERYLFIFEKWMIILLYDNNNFKKRTVQEEEEEEEEEDDDNQIVVSNVESIISRFWLLLKIMI
jgi:hypothetical protein